MIHSSVFNCRSKLELFVRTYIFPMKYFGERVGSFHTHVRHISISVLQLAITVIR